MVLSSRRHSLSYLIEGTVPQMGSLELVDETLVSPATISRKTPSLDAAPNRSFYSDGTKELNLKSMWNGVLNSIKVVLFSDKINLLVPFGPVAILVDELTSHHVSCKVLYFWTSFESLYICFFSFSACN